MDRLFVSANHYYAVLERFGYRYSPCPSAFLAQRKTLEICVKLCFRFYPSGEMTFKLSYLSQILS
jgi:hypothetical protein